MDTAHPTCARCGEELVLEMDPACPPDEEAVALLADPPFRYVCVSPGCAAASDVVRPAS